LSFRVKKGQQLLLTEGEYSDYSVIGIFTAKEDLNTKELKAEYLKSYPKQDQPYRSDHHKFVNWLCNTKNLVDEVDFRELHIGSYSSLSDMEID
jgi:hypothetical protein